MNDKDNNKSITLTRKIEVRMNTNDPNTKAELWQKLRNLFYASYKAHNKAMSAYHQIAMHKATLMTLSPSSDSYNEIKNQIQEHKTSISKLKVQLKKATEEQALSINEKIAEHQNTIDTLEQQKKSNHIKNALSNLSDEAIRIFKTISGTVNASDYSESKEILAPTSVVYQHISPLFSDGQSLIASSISRNTYDSFKAKEKDILSGKCSLPTFRQDAPIPINKQLISPITPQDSEFSVIINGYPFVTVNSYKDNSNLQSLYKVSQDPSLLCDSKLQIKGNKIFLLMSVKVQPTQHQFIPNLVLGVDLGIAIPVATALNRGFGAKKFGSSRDLFCVKATMARQYSKLKSSLVIKGGNGRKSVKRIDDRYNEKERNYTHTYNHTLSARVIQEAIKHKAGIIKIEDLSFHSFLDEDGNRVQREVKNYKMLRNWPYYELQQMLKYKAELNGIQVIKVNPAYTSQTCSKCGVIQKGNRKTQARYECECGLKINADINAAINIARSEAIRPW